MKNNGYLPEGQKPVRFSVTRWTCVVLTALFFGCLLASGYKSAVPILVGTAIIACGVLIVGCLYVVICNLTEKPRESVRGPLILMVVMAIVCFILVPAYIAALT